MHTPRAIAAAIILTTFFSRCTSSADVTSGSPGTPLLPPVTLLAVGDIASCSNANDDLTAALADTVDAKIIIPGDIAYESGSEADFKNCFEPSWGKLKSRIRPAPGNHEYETANAAPYYAYFGSAAGEAGKGYYSFNYGPWHIVAINSSIDVSAGSDQERWLRADLASNTLKCTLAFWHHPLFSSGPHGPTNNMRAIWTALYDGGAEVVVSGHDHDYERFAPQTALGVADNARGIRQFVAGTGGRSLYPPIFVAANSEVRSSEGYGILRFTLEDGGYSWKFVPTANTPTDSGQGTCH
jgi:hypothetical protein